MSDRITAGNVEILNSINEDSLTSKIDNVNEYLKNGHNSTSFIYFKVNQFELDTRDVDSFKHYAISLENKKTGVGQGNEFTLRIVYNKTFSHLGLNINDFEKALSTISDYALNTDTRKLDVERNKCYLQYGYLSDNTNLQTSMYEGMLLQYKVRANKQIVEYTLTGYTGEKAAIGTVSWYPKVKNSSNVVNNVVLNNSLSSEKDIANLSTEEIKKLTDDLNKVYNGPIKCSPYDALKIFIDDYNEDIKELAKNQNVTPVTFKIVAASQKVYDSLNNLKPLSISLCRNQTPLDYVKYLVSLFTEKIDNDDYLLKLYKQEKKIVDRWVYELKYSKQTDNNNGIVVEILLNKISSEESDIYDYHFKGYTPDNVLLLEYNLEYDGTVALTVSNTDNKSNSYYIDSGGKIQKQATLTKELFVNGAIDETLTQNQNKWLDKISCANNCSMTTMGLPFEIPVSSIFKVSMYIGDTPHHSSGRCYVTGVIDKISNGNFTTDFTMIRLPGNGVN